MDKKETVQDVLAEMRRCAGKPERDRMIGIWANRIEAAMGADKALAERVLDLLADTYIGRDGAAYAEARALITAQPDTAAPAFDYQDVFGSAAAAEAVRDFRELLHTAPEGWVMVPLEPTLEMTKAGEKVACVWQTAWECGEVYKAMLAAAQEPRASEKSVQP